jgi:RNA polymerase sigma-70 factor (ECF subfamily)
LGPKNLEQGAGAAAGQAGQPAFDIADLTGRMVKGDEMAYRFFYEEYYERLRRYLLVVTAGNEEASREALQSALVRVVRHIRKFRSDGEFWGWLTVLARTALFDQTRKRKRYWSFLERFTRHAGINHEGDIQNDPDEKLLALLDQNLATLPTDEKRLVESKYINGASVRELAKELDMSEKAVESRLVRIRRKLKSAMLEHLKNESLGK